MSAVIRAFIAIDISPEILRHIEEISRELKRRLKEVPVRWVAVNNIHLTLKFLGNVSVANLDLLKNVIKAETEQIASFEIHVNGLGAFPSVRRPHVIWTGVEAPPILATMQKGLDRETARLGYPSEERSFSAHLTLGRVSRNSSPADARRIAEVLENYKVGSLGKMRVISVNLYRSDLQPEGSIYTSLYHALLKAQDH